MNAEIKTVYQCAHCMSLMTEETLQQHQCNISESSSTVSENSKKGKQEGMWTHEMVKCLLAHYAKHKEKFGMVDFTQKRIFEIIAESMKEDGYEVSWDKCMDKFKTMRRTYKRIFVRKKTSGFANYTFPFFDEMDAILGKDPVIHRLVTYGSSNNSPSYTEETSTTRPSTSRSFNEQFVFQNVSSEASSVTRPSNNRSFTEQFVFQNEHLRSDEVEERPLFKSGAKRSRKDLPYWSVVFFKKWDECERIKREERKRREAQRERHEAQRQKRHEEKQKRHEERQAMLLAVLEEIKNKTNVS